MSKTFSKIMLICALVVIVPLMIVGTAFASYYSVTAIVNVAIVTLDGTENIDPTVQHDAYAKILYDAKEHQGNFKVSDSHMKTVALKAQANGFTFVGWYKGTAQQYRAELITAPTEIKYVGEEDTLKMKMSEYDDVLAVFEIEKLGVTYNYKRHQSDADNTTTAPEGFTNTYNYGDELPAFNAENHYTHNGWFVNGDTTKVYKYATFEDGAELSANWVRDEEYHVTYKYNNGSEVVDLGVSADKFVGEATELPTEPVDAGWPALTAGKKYVWKVNGSVVTSVSKAATAVLTIEDVSYTANVVSSSSVIYKNAATFAIENAASLNALFDSKTSVDSNWTKDYSFWKVEKINYNGTEYANATDLYTAIVNANPNADATVNLTPLLTQYFSSVGDVNSVEYSSQDGPNSFNGAVYYRAGANIMEVTSAQSLSSVSSDTNLEQWLSKGRELYNDADGNNQVHAYQLSGAFGTSAAEITITGMTTINDLIEYIYTTRDVELADTFVFNSEFEVYFA